MFSLYSEGSVKKNQYSAIFIADKKRKTAYKTKIYPNLSSRC